MLRFSKWSFVRFSHPTVTCTSPLPLCVPHTLPISLFLIWSTGYYLINRLLFDQPDIIWTIGYYLINRILFDQPVIIWSTGYYLNNRILFDQPDIIWSTGYYLINWILFDQPGIVWSTGYYLINRILFDQPDIIWSTGYYFPFRFHRYKIIKSGKSDKRQVIEFSAFHFSFSLYFIVRWLWKIRGRLYRRWFGQFACLHLHDVTTT